uniref:50S ribosome-binding GTPase/Elongation factor Tu GTP binding domain/Translation-initiation factor 2, putative n=1 Tax=Theileria annulata TaxID=5874 RepID=A0A3B0MHX5_THEAN
MLYYSSIKLYKGKNNPIGRIGFRKILFNGRKQKSPEILLPPFISISELRLMLNLDYISCFRNAKISITKNLYKWSDSYGRTFQTNNKRNIIISYDISSYLSKLMGYKPIKIDPEPKIPQKIKNHIPIISIVGHKNHGKTTLINNFTDVKNNNYIINSYNIIEEKLKYIILDTPGDMNYDIIRGRAIYNSDICIIVISSQGPEIITRNVILQADKFKIPILFCITKTDLYFNLEILKSELQLQCEILYQSGHISNNYFNEINNLILSNNLKTILNKYIKLRYGDWSTATNSIKDTTSTTGTTGASTVTEENNSTKIAASGKGANFTATECTSGKGANSMGTECTMGKGTNKDSTIKEAPFGASTEDTSLGGPDTVTEKYKKYIRRSNSLIKSGNGIKGIGNIIEITKTESKGIIINLLVKFGQIVEGNYFIVGTTYEKMNMVGVGELVSITGLKSLDGVGLDDTLLIMSQHDAFRLSQYRKQLEILKSLQIQGPPIHSFNIQSGAGVDGVDGVGEGEVRVDEGIEYISKYSGKGMVVEGGKGVNNEEVVEETTLGDCRDTDTVTENKINKFENIESTIYLKPLEYDSDTVLGPTEGTEDSKGIKDITIDTPGKGANDTFSTMGKGANSMVTECTSEKILNEIAVVTKTGESGTNSKGVSTKDTNGVSDGTGTVGASTVTGKKIIPIILRVNYMSILEIILNGLEEIEKEYNVRIPLIHGGIGPIIPIDIVQAQIGNKFTYCPVYSFQVPIHNDAAKHAIINKIVIKSFNIQSDLFNDIIQRCKTTLHKYNNSIS